MPPKRGTVVAGEAETSSEDEAVIAPAVADPQPVEAPADEPSNEAENHGPDARESSPSAAPKVKAKKARRPTEARKKQDQSAAAPPAVDEKDDAANKAKRRPTVRVVEALPPSPKKTVVVVPPEPEAETPPVVTPSARVERVVEEDEFGDAIVTTRVVEEEPSAIDDALGHAEASEPDMVGSPDLHRRNLMAFADAGDEEEGKAGSPDAVRPQHDDGLSFVDRLKRKLQKASAKRESSARGVSESATRHADPESATPPATGTTLATTPLDEAMRNLKRVASRKPTEVLGHYHPSSHPNRCEEHRIDISVRLKHEVVPPPPLPDMATPPASLAAPFRASAKEPQPVRPATLPPLAYALQDVKRVAYFEAVRDGQAQIHYHASAAERRGHIAMQAKANAEAASAVAGAIAAGVAEMRRGTTAYFSAGASLVAP